MKQYPAIDLAKLMAAVLVITVHTDPLSSYSPAVNYLLVTSLARLAVPFFFLSAGFLLAEKMRREHRPARAWPLVKQYLSRIGALYLVWTAVYLPFAVYTWIAHYQMAPGYWGMFVQRSLFQGSYYTLWFLPALLLAVPGAAMLRKRLSPSVALPLCLLLYTVGTLGQTYFDLLPPSDQLSSLIAAYDGLFLTTRNGLFFGLPFVYLGMWLSGCRVKLSRRAGFCWFALSAAALAWEAWSLHQLPFTRGNGMWFCLLPATAFLMLWLREVRLPDSQIYLDMRKMSTLLYVSHGLPVIVYPWVTALVPLDNSLVRFLFVLGGSLCLSGLLMALGRRPSLRQLLKNVY